RDRADGAAVAQVAGDQPAGFGRLAVEAREPLGDIAMGGAMEAVAADTLAGVLLVGQAVEIRPRRHGVVEGGVEDGDGDGMRQHRPAGVFSWGFVRVVRGGRLRTALEGAPPWGVGACRLEDAPPAVNHPVAYPRDLLDVFDHAALAQPGEGGRDRRRMVRD